MSLFASVERTASFSNPKDTKIRVNKVTKPVFVAFYNTVSIETTPAKKSAPKALANTATAETLDDTRPATMATTTSTTK